MPLFHQKVAKFAVSCQNMNIGMKKEGENSHFLMGLIWLTWVWDNCKKNGISVQ